MEGNLSVILYGKNDLRIKFNSECRTLVSVPQMSISHGRIADFIVTSPMLLGHEASGVVSKLGEGVTNLTVGDRVAIEPSVPCRICTFCKTGRYNLCNLCATPSIDGNLARYYCHAADFCYKLPDNVSTEEGALLEPHSVALHACLRAGVNVDSTVLISGAGPIGLSCFLMAKAMGTKKICITDVDDSHLEFSKKIGVHHVLSVRSGTSKELASQIEVALGQSPQISIECSGNPAGLKTCMLATGNGGCVVMVGLQPNDVTVPLLNAAVREVDIRGSLRYVNW